MARSPFIAVLLCLTATPYESRRVDVRAAMVALKKLEAHQSPDTASAANQEAAAKDASAADQSAWDEIMQMEMALAGGAEPKESDVTEHVRRAQAQMEKAAAAAVLENSIAEMLANQAAATASSQQQQQEQKQRPDAAAQEERMTAAEQSSALDAAWGSKIFEAQSGMSGIGQQAPEDQQKTWEKVKHDFSEAFKYGSEAVAAARAEDNLETLAKGLGELATGELASIPAKENATSATQDLGSEQQLIAAVAQATQAAKSAEEEAETALAAARKALHGAEGIVHAVEGDGTAAVGDALKEVNETEVAANKTAGDALNIASAAVREALEAVKDTEAVSQVLH